MTKACNSGARILVAGLGNLLLTDDGAGVHAVRELRRRAPRGAAIVEVGTAVLDALHLFEWADRVLAIDAVQAGGAPAAIYILDAREAAPTPATASLHQLDLLSALQLAKKRPREIVILGVEPHTIGYGMELSPFVREALPQLVEAAETIIARWRNY